jgi:hypothetical protein
MTRDELAELDPDLLLADGFDEAILGVASRCGSPDVVVYDYDKCVGVLVARDGMTEDEAIEWMDFNVVGAYVGERTPWFMHRA